MEETLDQFKEVLERSVKLHGTSKAFTLKRGKGEYKDISYVRYYEEVKCLGEAMIRAGFAGERIALIGKNSYAWFLVNAATQLSGSVSVPLDKELKEEELETSLVRSEAKVIFYDKNEAEIVRRAIDKGRTSIKHAYPLWEAEGKNVFDLLEEGKELMGEGSDEITRVVIDSDAVSYLIFTSGTTSQSKIVMLSQKNITSNLEGLLEAEPFKNTDTNIALLPYHHTFGLTGQWLMLANGCRTVYCDGLKHIQNNFKEYGVSIFIGVPLLIESMYAKIMKTAEKEGLDGRIRTMGKVCRVLNKAKIDLRRTVFKGVLNALGGKLRMVVLGAAAADPECIKGFNDFGVMCIQGYGLTETSPVLSAERPTHRRPGSIGIPMVGVEMDIFAPDENGIGEIIARGDNVMKGYYGDKEATDAVMIDGWFHTGDLGYRDKDGYYFITGRKKNVIVLKNGKNVFPEELEMQIGALPYALENIVIGIPAPEDERDLTVALKMVYDPEQFPGKSEEKIRAAVTEDIDKINEKLPAYKRIKRIYLSDEPMEKTSTGKIKRFLELERLLGARNE